MVHYNILYCIIKLLNSQETRGDRPPLGGLSPFKYHFAFSSGGGQTLLK